MSNPGVRTSVSGGAARRSCGNRASSVKARWPASARVIVAQQFLDRGRQQVGPLLQQRQLVGVGEQRVHAVRDEVDRRRVTGREQQVPGRRQLILGEPVTLLVRGDERREKIVAGFRTAAGDQLAHEIEQPDGGRDVGVATGQRAGDQLAGAGPEPGEVTLRDAAGPAATSVASAARRSASDGAVNKVVAALSRATSTASVMRSSAPAGRCRAHR